MILTPGKVGAVPVDIPQLHIGLEGKGEDPCHLERDPGKRHQRHPQAAGLYLTVIVGIHPAVLGILQHTGHHQVGTHIRVHVSLSKEISSAATHQDVGIEVHVHVGICRMIPVTLEIIEMCPYKKGGSHLTRVEKAVKNHRIKSFLSLHHRASHIAEEVDGKFITEQFEFVILCIKTVGYRDCQQQKSDKIFSHSFRGYKFLATKVKFPVKMS
jgi:hypothetical protein